MMRWLIVATVVITCGGQTIAAAHDAGPSFAGYDATATCIGGRATAECFRMQQLGRIMASAFWKKTDEKEHFNCLASYPGPDILPLSYCLNGYVKQREAG